MELCGEPTRIPLPKAIEGSLAAMEVDPNQLAQSELLGVLGPDLEGDEMVKDLKDWLANLPGVDEAMALTSILKYVDGDEYDVLVFDTAPTGHTIRLLQLPAVLKAGIAKLESWKVRLGGVLGSVAQAFGKKGGAMATAAAKQQAVARLYARLLHYSGKIEEVADLFRAAERTKFVVVCIAEYLSVFESARLMGELHSQGIACEHIIVNQLLPIDFTTLAADVRPLTTGLSMAAGGLALGGGVNRARNAAAAAAVARVGRACELCAARARIQEKYLAQLAGAVGAKVTIVRMPLLEGEVRGVHPLLSFSDGLVRPCIALHPVAAAAASSSAASGGSSSSSSSMESPLADLMKSLMSAAPSAEAQAAAAPSPPAGDAEAAAKRAFGRLQIVLLEPNGVALMMQTNTVQQMERAAKERGDYALQRFFRAVKGPQGAMGGMSFLSNDSVVASLRSAAPGVLAELTAAGTLPEINGSEEQAKIASAPLAAVIAMAPKPSRSSSSEKLPRMPNVRNIPSSEKYLGKYAGAAPASAATSSRSSGSGGGMPSRLTPAATSRYSAPPPSTGGSSSSSISTSTSTSRFSKSPPRLPLQTSSPLMGRSLHRSKATVSTSADRLAAIVPDAPLSRELTRINLANCSVLATTAERDYNENCGAKSLLCETGEKRWMTTPLPKHFAVAADIVLARPAQIREIHCQTTDANRELRLVGEASDGTQVQLQAWKAFPAAEIVRLSRGDGCAVVKLRLETRHIYRWGSMNAGVDALKIYGVE